MPRATLVSLAFLALVAVGTASPALAAADDRAPLPGDRRVGVLFKPFFPLLTGADLELPLGRSPWRVGGLYQVEIFETSTGVPGAYTWVNPAKVTAWTRYELIQEPDQTLGLLAGASYAPQPILIDQPVAEPLRWIGPVIGASYRLRSGRLWLRLTPHWFYMAPSQASGDFLWLFGSGLPWAEIGFQLLPGAEIGFRLADAPLRFSWTF